MDKYRQAFDEEARELLVELESALLELDRNPDDRELVGRAFRALPNEAIKRGAVDTVLPLPAIAGSILTRAR